MPPSDPNLSAMLAAADRIRELERRVAELENQQRASLRVIFALSRGRKPDPDDVATTGCSFQL